MVEARNGPSDTDDFPPELDVEDRHSSIPAPAALAVAERGALAAGVDLARIEKVRRFPRGLPVQVR